MQSFLSKKFKKELAFHKPALRIVLGIFGGVFTYIFSKIMIFKPDGLYIGQPNSWSDWVVHISITQLFAQKPISEWFLYHPFYAHGKLTYGFLSHLITAVFMRIGLPIDMAFFVVSVILLFSFLAGLYFLYFQLSNSRKQSVWAIFLVLTSSGLGIFKHFESISWNEILHPTQDYSRFLEYDWYAGNIPEAMLIPQRAFFIGVTIGVWVLNLLLWGIKQKRDKKNNYFHLNLQKKLFLVAGILAGILPIAHMHSFIVLVLVTGVICLSYKEKFYELLYFVIPAGILSTILYFNFVHGGIEVDNFMRISFGWTVNKTLPQGASTSTMLISWATMWLKVWGAFLPLALFAIYRLKKNRAVFLGFLAVFLVSNIITFQPTAWDNTKLFAWVYIGLSIAVVSILAEIWKKNFKLKVLVIILMFSLSATGIVELFRILNFEQNTHLLSSASEITLGKKIAKETATDAVFLTSTKHNHLIPLWANRPIFLGYLGWVKNFGFNDSERNADARSIFSGSNSPNQLIIKNKISYIFVGPNERREFTVNDSYLQQFPVAFETEDTVIYDSRQLWQ